MCQFVLPFLSKVILGTPMHFIFNFPSWALIFPVEICRRLHTSMRDKLSHGCKTSSDRQSGSVLLSLQARSLQELAKRAPIANPAPFCYACRLGPCRG